MRSRGYSLIEAILASFLLVFTFFMVSRLFQTGLQYSARVDSRLEAVAVAEKRMAKFRAWAKKSKSWTGYPNDATDPAHPAYTIVTQVANVDGGALFSPSRVLEDAHAPDNRRSMPTAARKVTLTVTGGRGAGKGPASYRLAGIVTHAEPAFDRIEIDGDVGPLGPDSGPGSPRVFTVKAYDLEGDEIKDIYFHWNVEPVFGLGNPSSADIRYNRDGKRAELRNRVKARNGVWVPQKGYCRAIAYVRYKGRFRSRRTDPIELKP